MKKISEKKQKEQSTKFLCMFIVVIAFTLAFVLLINKQHGDSYLNDLRKNSINIRPEVGKTIVAKDMKAIYPKYYVAYINDDSYSIYVFNYYETISQYNLEFARLKDVIVDYNAKDKMIRYLDSRGYGTYNEVLSNLSILVGCDDLLVY